MDGVVRVLEFTIGAREFTGIASFLYQYYKRIDRNRVRLDFFFCRQNSMDLVKDDVIFDNSKFFVLNAIKGHNSDNDYYKVYHELVRLLSDNRYDVLHINTYRVFFNLIAIAAGKRAGVKTIISHSHNVVDESTAVGIKNRIKKVMQSLCSCFIRNNADCLFACSKGAGEVLFGKKGVDSDKFHVVKNAIDSEKYIYTSEKHVLIRKRENISSSTFLLGQVGRLTYQKNQTFTLNVFSEILQKIPDAELWLIGVGEDTDKLIKKAVEMDISNHIHFFGQRKDVHKLMVAMNALLLPSTYEGLGIVAIEAQAAGLPTYASTGIPTETHITDLISYMPLSDGPKKWAKYILEDLPKHKRRDTHQEIIDHGYDIVTAAKWLEDFYCSKRK
jgi:glycosyltransferase involved in cell wall biosynthesis